MPWASTSRPRVALHRAGSFLVWPRGGPAFARTARDRCATIGCPAVALSRSLAVLALVALLLGLAACESTGDGKSGDPTEDPHVERGGGDLDEDRTVLSPPELEYPIYECASVVNVKSFIPGAEIQILVNGVVKGGGFSNAPYGATFQLGDPFVAGQVITALQIFDGQPSMPSNAVPVTSHLEDYPDGLPEPGIRPPPLHQCGGATSFDGLVPGAWAEVWSRSPDGVGGFEDEARIARIESPSWTSVSPDFVLGARVRARTGLCDEISEGVAFETVQPEPSTIANPSIDTPIIEGQETVVVRDIVNGAELELSEGTTPVAGFATPGGSGQVMGIPPAPAGGSYSAKQWLCDPSSAGTSTTVPVEPCSALPPAKIEQPLPGDTQVEVTEFIPGSRIIIFASGQEVGDAGGPLVNLVRPLQAGETVVVVQEIGDCRSVWVYVIDVECALGGDDLACSGDWPAYRHNGLRNARQVQTSALSYPYNVRKLEVGWRFTPPGARGFRASAVVWDGMVYIGNGNGYLYALDAATGARVWTFPDQDNGEAPLRSQFESNASSRGIAASVAIARIEGRPAVILGAPDPRIGANLGSGRVFALDPGTGAVVWQSGEVAVLDGLTRGSQSELHEQMGYSSPLVFKDRVYVGIANHGDNPIQIGRVHALDVFNGNDVGGFAFSATPPGTRGGGVWTSVAGGLERGDIYITTGNTRCWNPATCQPEPNPNYGLSMLRLDAGSGAVEWQFQPVEYDADGDPDWAAGATLVDAACGDLVVSTMKDGWSYALNATSPSPPDPSLRWQFPPTGLPFKFGDGTAHGDSRYLVPGAAWDDTYVTMTGGEEVVSDVSAGFSRLHALQLCAGNKQRVRWIKDVPGVDATTGAAYRLGPPTVTRGIVFVGTHQAHLVAIADPDVWPAPGSRCSNPEVPLAACEANNFRIVPDPAILLDIDVGSGSILTEPVIAGGRVYVATTDGELIMLEPGP